MPSKKTVSQKKQPASKQKPASFINRLKEKTVTPIRRRTKGLLNRRPHRSFQQTRRRDYVRSLKLPGYWAFTNYVRRTLWKSRKVFAALLGVYLVLSVLLIGIASQDTYTELSSVLRETGSEVFKGNWGEMGQAGLLLITGVTGQFNAAPTEAQQVYAVIFVFFTWLTTVWLLRAILAGKKPRLRDGLYNAGAPVLPTALVGLLLLVQLFPLAVAILGFSALVPLGVLEGGVESMLFWTAALLLVSLSLYWVTATLIALVVVTLPGMYPMQAIKAAGDLVIGRRVRILLRFLWLILITAVGWVLIMVPVILLDTWLKGMWPVISWIPVVPVMLLVMGTATIVWTASYIYLFYRRVVDDDAAPA
jgi:hypothetical protein